MIDPPVTPEERIADALAAFELICDRAIEHLELLALPYTGQPLVM
jgi:hypothetical protein